MPARARKRPRVSSGAPSVYECWHKPAHETDPIEPSSSIFEHNRPPYCNRNPPPPLIVICCFAMCFRSPTGVFRPFRDRRNRTVHSSIVPMALGCCSRKCLAGDVSPTDARWPGGSASQPRRTAAGTGISNRASARPATPRARTMLVELAWPWLRLQPDSLLTQWCNRITGALPATASACDGWASSRWRGVSPSRYGLYLKHG
ncbi:hypothetical protein LMG24235_08603 [Paraburkholderia sabiae]|nr:hypothetical protein LMG24235_08603 [Paraburkholderia sabiae]